ncbi:heme-dependent catalase [Ceratobasidium sp. AG-I]|nr:heme-dependent catalase [Ceratobasidium sp. AG-I]
MSCPLSVFRLSTLVNGVARYCLNTGALEQSKAKAPSLTQKHDPQTSLKDVGMFWDYFSQNPESVHQAMTPLGERAIPDDYRPQNEYSGHALKWVNYQGELQYAQVHCRQQEAKGVELTGSNPDYATQDLFEKIESGKAVKWNVFIQTISPEQAETFRDSFLDLTKIWPHNQFPLQPVGTLVLDRNPENHFNEIKQVAFAPSHLVPGVKPSADLVLQSRLFSYPDTHRHRLGVNYQQIPVNAPLCSVANLQRAGLMNVLTRGARPNYQSSIAPLAYKNKTVSTTNHETFIGAAVADLSEITELDFDNVAGHLGGAKSAEVKVRQLSVFAAVDQTLLDRLAKALGVSTVKPLAVKPAAEAVRFKASCVTGPIAISRA